MLIFKSITSCFYAWRNSDRDLMFAGKLMFLFHCSAPKCHKYTFYIERIWAMSSYETFQKYKSNGSISVSFYTSYFISSLSLQWGGKQFSKEQLFNHSRTSDSGVWEAYIYGVVVQYITVAVQKYCVRHLWRYVYLFSFGVLRISNLH